jgi:hypothetical protein
VSERYWVELACNHTVYRQIRGGRVEPSYRHCGHDQVVLRYLRLTP